MTHVYLAASANIGTSSRVLDAWDWDARPLNLLLAYPYLRQYRSRLAGAWKPARTMLDSGAFTAFQIGALIDRDALTNETLRGTWTESVSLDVIGDWQGSLANFTAMRARRSPAMPVFHYGDPWDLLDLYASTHSKIGLGGLVGRPLRDVARFCDSVFARLWPWPFHAFGQTRDDLLLDLPFASADSTAWMVPATFARSVTLRGSGKIKQVHGCSGRVLGPTLAYTIERELELQERLRAHWRNELAQLDRNP